MSTFIICMGYGSYLAFNGKMVVGQIVVFLQLLNYILYPFTQLPGQIAQFKMKKISIDRVYELLSLEKENIAEAARNNSDEKVTTLLISNLSFAYNDDSDLIFDKFTTSFDVNKLTGIIGPSGCGKSTILQLILGLYKANSGRIELRRDDSIICENSKLRSMIAYVPQDHVLFSGTIADNIRYNNTDTSIEDVIDAAKRANVHEFISKLDMGYDTLITENGKNLSIGQAQRIAIARAFLKKSPVIILDEPAASVDMKSEKYIMESLCLEKKDKIIIIVTHNKEAQEFCDNIIDLSK